MPAETRRVRLRNSDLELEVLLGDSIIGPAIERGAWAEHETELLRAHMVPGCKVVDLGANIGWFSVQAILAGAEVDAFEPVPEIAEVCERNLRRAEERGPGRGRVHRCAAGAERGRAQIALARENRGDNRVLDLSSATPRDMRDPELTEIQVERVDDLVRGPIRFLKVDTQGSEWLAIRGSERVISESPEMALLLEFWPYALRGADPRALLEHFSRLGFTLGKATAAPYPMAPERILRQALARDPVRGGIDLYGTRGLAFHVGSPWKRLRSFARSVRED